MDVNASSRSPLSLKSTSGKTEKQGPTASSCCRLQWIVMV